MKDLNQMIEKYGEMLISQQLAIINIKYIIDNLNKNIKYYENCEELLLHQLTRAKDNLARVLADEI